MEATVREGHAPAVVVALQAGCTTDFGEAGAMMFISGDISTDVEMPGGVVGGLKRKLLAGRSIFLTRYQANGPGAVGITGQIPRLDPAAHPRRRNHLREARYLGHPR